MTTPDEVTERIDRIEKALAELGNHVRVMVGHGMICPSLAAIIADIEELAAVEQ